MAGPAPFPPPFPCPPFRRAFDVAQSPYAARNALGITGTGGGSGGISDAPSDGNIYGRKNTAWVDLELSYQPLDGDLTALAALSGTNTIYYRSGTSAWSAVTIGTGLSFSGGTLSCTISTAGLQPLDATLTALAAYNTNGLLTQTAADTFTGRTLAGPAAGITVGNGDGIAGNPTLALANDLAALEALSGTNNIYYRSGIDAWSSVVIGSGLTFSGGTLSASGGSAITSAPQEGRLTFVSTTALKFAPFNGNKIRINGATFTIPNAGIAGVSNTSVFVNGAGSSNLAASTTYYVYAFSNSGTVTADFRTDGNGHITDTTSDNEGQEVRCSSGTTPDPTRTLIGIVRTNASSQFADNNTQRFVRSWFNRKPVKEYAALNGASTISASLVELSANLRCEFVAFSDDKVNATYAATCTADVAGRIVSAGISLDGTAPPSSPVGFQVVQIQSGGNNPVTPVSNFDLTDGYHYVTPFGATNGGTATFTYSNFHVLIL